MTDQTITPEPGPGPGLYAACPHCEAVFVVGEAHLNAKEGLVRCGACGEIFNARWHLTEQSEGAVAGREAEAALGDAPEIAGSGATNENGETAENDKTETGQEHKDAVHAHQQPPDQVSERPAEWRETLESPELSESPQTPAANARPDRPDRINMNGVDDYIAPRAGVFNTLSWSVAALVLVALLGWQLKYPFLEKYVQHRDYRAFLSVCCDFFNCELPPRRDLPRLTLTHTRIDLHPLAPGAIRVTVKLVNEATFAQPWPDLQVTLTDRDGRVVGRRTFPPGRYLGEGQPGVLGSGELGVVLFDLARPHEKAVGFEVGVVAGSTPS